jgi:hypothetical protein
MPADAMVYAYYQRGARVKGRRRITNSRQHPRVHQISHGPRLRWEQADRADGVSCVCVLQCHSRHACSRLDPPVPPTISSTLLGTLLQTSARVGRGRKGRACHAIAQSMPSDTTGGSTPGLTGMTVTAAASTRAAHVLPLQTPPTEVTGRCVCSTAAPRPQHWPWTRHNLQSSRVRDAHLIRLTWTKQRKQRSLLQRSCRVRGQTLTVV